MRQILYFLLGFLGIMILTTLSYAIDCYDPYTDGQTPLNSYIGYTFDDRSETTTTYSVASIAASYFYDNFSTIKPGYTRLGQGISYYDITHVTGFHWVSYRSATVFYMAFWPFTNGTQFTYDRCIVDADSDGLPDTCDSYPNDATPYQVAVIYKQTLISSGSVTYQQLKTDRGDIFERGELHQGNPLYRDYLFINPILSDPSTFCDSNLENTGQQSTVDYQSQLDAITQAKIDNASLPTISTLTPPPSESKTGTETDNQALQKIVGNTNAINTNISNLAKYLSDINQSVKGMEVGQYRQGVGGSLGSIAGTGTNNGALESTQLQIKDKLTEISGKIPTPPSASDISAAQSAAGNNDTSYNNTVEALGTGLVIDDAPEFYRQKTSISEKMTSIMGSNPISDIIGSSGVNLTGSQPYLSWSYNGTPILLRVDLYDSALDAFGSILLAMTGLSCLVMLFKG